MFGKFLRKKKKPKTAKPEKAAPPKKSLFFSKSKTKKTSKPARSSTSQTKAKARAEFTLPSSNKTLTAEGWMRLKLKKKS